MAGRPNKYDTLIKPYFDYIDKQLNNGASEKQIAQSLGVAYSSWMSYKNQYEEFKTLCNKPRSLLIDNLRSALVKRALGFEYEEKKVYTKNEDGKIVNYTELTRKQALPDVTAIFGCLNIYDPEYVKDKKNYELKQEELALRKQLADADNW